MIAVDVFLAAGASKPKPLNTAWKKRWMDALEEGDFVFFETITERSIDMDAGLSVHESKAWLVAHAALPLDVSGCAFHRYLKGTPTGLALKPN